MRAQVVALHVAEQLGLAGHRFLNALGTRGVRRQERRVRDELRPQRGGEADVLLGIVEGHGHLFPDPRPLRQVRALVGQEHGGRVHPLEAIDLVGHHLVGLGHPRPVLGIAHLPRLARQRVQHRLVAGPALVDRLPRLRVGLHVGVVDDLQHADAEVGLMHGELARALEVLVVRRHRLEGGLANCGLLLRGRGGPTRLGAHEELGRLVEQVGHARLPGRPEVIEHELVGIGVLLAQ